MEEITKAAKAFYANLADEEKREVEDLFSSMDKNGDGKISRQEFMAFGKEGGVNPIVKRSLFNLVDQDGDGSLQKDEILTLCYIIASGRPNCDGCGIFIPGLFFTCTHCRLTKRVDVKESYDLCIPCYHGREFVHEHTEFVDNYMLLFRMQGMLSSGEITKTSASQSVKANGSKSKRREEKEGTYMEEITQAAKAAYENFTDEEKREMEDLFSSMDKNGDGKISLQEFMAFGKEGGINPMVKRSIFNLVDQHCHGRLQMDEFLTLCYIIASGRPTCDGCGIFITGLFFTCTHCRLNNKAEVKENYDLCIPCYHGREFVHEHTEFVDNYMLLFRMQEILASGEQDRITQSTSSGALEFAESATTSASHSFKSSGSKKAKREKMKRAFRIFAAVLSVAANAQTLSLMTV